MEGISIVLPTLNRTTFLTDTLDYLVVQEFDHPFEILIVDQSDTYNYAIDEYQWKYPFIKYFHITFFKGLPEARNFGWEHALYDYILYLDDDISCKKNLLAEHYRYITQKGIGVVAGGITEKYKKEAESRTGKFNYWTATPERGFYKKGLMTVDHAGGGNFSIKKSVIKQVGGVDEHLSKGAALFEETDLCLRVIRNGYKILFNYDAHVYHLAADTGGCRVKDIDKYIFSLVRNRTIIIQRYLKWYNKITANLFMMKLGIAYIFSYKKVNLINSYLKGLKEGLLIARQMPKCTIAE
ncbi:MAG: glycosyltransferase [Tannerella sp.]|jgi:GT2 family glycosyltransferase|nr:glycosyltransferase [Tannerella sp.]